MPEPAQSRAAAAHQKPRRLEEVQHVLRARCSPQGEKTMIRVRERTPATDGDGSRIAPFRQDHVS